MTYPAIDRLLPHREPALLLRAVVRWEADLVECTAGVSKHHPLAAAGQAPASLAMEMGAQAGAALEALCRAGESTAAEPRVGYLVGMRECAFHAPQLPVGVALEVRVQRTGGAGPLTQFAVEVRAIDASLLATGQVSAYATTR